MTAELDGGSEGGVSSLFAHRAAEALARGDADGALALCTEGIGRFPKYATGYLVLAQCCEALGRTLGAVVAYRRAARLLPDNALVHGLVERAEERERADFEAYAERQRRARAAEGAAEAPSAPPAPAEVPAPAELPARAEAAARAPEGAGGMIVSATLAEIFADQGAWAEAIETYRRLIEERPAEAARYTRRVAELRGKLGEGQQKAP